MSRIRNAFENGKAFIAFVTGGDPDLETTKELLLSMQEAGADLIEIGVPFSDPIAEGEVIQRANERALLAGCTVKKLFKMVEEVRGRVTVPLVFLTYMNPIHTYGSDPFIKKCLEVGIDGIIVPDLPFEENGELLGICDSYGVDLISMVAPTSKERVVTIAKDARGFLYCVSSLGVTGVRSDIQTMDAATMIRMAKETSDVPCAVGFGVSTPRQAKEVATFADGVIVGSAIVKLVEAYGTDCVKPVFDYVKKMKEAVS